ncbi:L,D-transpeptidase family protein [Streptomyces sp. NPDC059460]|uniref:L,D-transpeptidase family protein n=1 Tax=Streptomyces sp. NPDC059460 TaxID=3346840 RepID=UPI0036891A64
MPERVSRPRRCRRPPYAVCAALFLVLTGCGASGTAPAAVSSDGSRASRPAGTSGAAGPVAARGPAAPRRSREIRLLGQWTRAAIPADSRQALVVTGDSADSSLASAVLYTREDSMAGWQPALGPWPAHNALKGWTDEHRAGDLRTPIGVYGLTAAGGRLAAPGTAFPYEQNPLFNVSGEGFQGDSLKGSFDYVIAIDYNRIPGASPLDPTRPLGEERGGGIWLHVDHGGPTQGCISLPKDRMRELLRVLDPAKMPVVVMGDAAALAR